MPPTKKLSKLLTKVVTTKKARKSRASLKKLKEVLAKIALPQAMTPGTVVFLRGRDCHGVLLSTHPSVDAVRVALPMAATGDLSTKAFHLIVRTSEIFPLTDQTSGKRLLPKGFQKGLSFKPLSSRTLSPGDDIIAGGAKGIFIKGTPLEAGVRITSGDRTYYTALPRGMVKKVRA